MPQVVEKNQASRLQVSNFGQSPGRLQDSHVVSSRSQKCVAKLRHFSSKMMLQSNTITLNCHNFGLELRDSISTCYNSSPSGICYVSLLNTTLFLRDLALAKPLGKDWPIEKMMKEKDSKRYIQKNTG